MSLPFFEFAEARLDALVRPGMLCAFDFDGTLAPIAMDPQQVSVPVAVARRLARLADYSSVAIVSGRAIADVRAKLDIPLRYIVGNHGLEGIPGYPPDERHTLLCMEWEKNLSTLLDEHRLFALGVRIENKGYSLSVHYRLARDHTQIEMQLLEILDKLIPAPHVISGKCVFNLLPNAGLDKGTAISRLMEDSATCSAVYVGDDITDEDVFRLRRADLLTVRVGPGCNSSAEFFLHHRLGVVQLLDELISRLQRVP